VNEAYQLAIYDIRDFNMKCQHCGAITTYIKKRVFGKFKCTKCGKEETIYFKN
jgi:predicted RNA-binding Zn-ribbon protein involved in translation (DUF1610 family)